MNSHILVADVLGFSQLVNNLDHTQLVERLNVWVNLIEDIGSETGIQDVQFISDTIFVREDDSVDGFERLLQFGRALLERGLANHFPIRGAISKGDLTWGKLIYGKAISRGHELERQQEWIGIACESDLANAPWSWDLVCCYLVPKKTGPILSAPVVVWNIPERDNLRQQCAGEGLFKVGKLFFWELHSKLANTLAFSKYVQKAKRHELDPAKYHSGCSVGPI